MKYCINYRRGFKYIKDVDEINIDYNPKDTTLGQFMQKHKDQRINIYINHVDDFIANDRVKLFNQLVIDNPDIDFALVLPGIKNNSKAEEAYNIIKEYNIKYYFFEMVTNWDMLWGYIVYNPSDMFIAEELGFELDTVAEVLHSFGIKIRAFANVAQSSWKHTPALKKFFIRPDDIDIYEQYIDVIEFFGKEKSIETLYRIYAIDKKWAGPLNEVISDFDSDIDSRFIIPIFAEKRLSCGRRCLKGHSCQVCEAIERLSKTLENNSIRILTKNA